MIVRETNGRYDGAHVPLVMGGQGRSGVSLVRDAHAILLVVTLFALTVGASYGCLVLLGRRARWSD